MSGQISGLRAHKFNHRTLIALVSFTFLGVSVACKRIDQTGSGEAYIENGKPWAFGSVQLSHLDEPGELVLTRKSAVETFDSTQYALMGQISRPDGAVVERQVAYVDYHPQHDRALAYAFQLDFRRRTQSGNGIDVYAVLAKAGRTYNAHRIYLGTALFVPGELKAKVDAHDSLKLSLIARGVFQGFWAVHYAHIQRNVIRPWGTMCKGRVGQAPQQSPGQNPFQSGLECRPLPQEIDLCQGDPTRPGCQPEAPFQPTPNTENEIVANDNAEIQIGAEGRVFVMPAGTNRAKFVFTAQETGSGANTDFCAKKFFAVARTVGDQVNSACELKPAPFTAADGAVACAITVEFKDAATYLERICNVTARFSNGSQSETRTIQILKK